jgi:hypothetical protein
MAAGYFGRAFRQLPENEFQLFEAFLDVKAPTDPFRPLRLGK